MALKGKSFFLHQAPTQSHQSSLIRFNSVWLKWWGGELLSQSAQTECFYFPSYLLSIMHRVFNMIKIQRKALKLQPNSFCGLRGRDHNSHQVWHMTQANALWAWRSEVHSSQEVCCKTHSHARRVCLCVKYSFFNFRLDITHLLNTVYANSPS